MKKLLFLVVLGLASCAEPNVDSKPTNYTVGESGFTKELQIVTIEGCEYFFADYDRGAIFEHKGNCKNHIR